jgi:hypothetical protein
MFEIIIAVFSFLVGAIVTALWPKARTWSDKQGASISKRWTAVRSDYEQFSVQARNEFERIEAEAEAKINELKARYRK